METLESLLRNTFQNPTTEDGYRPVDDLLVGARRGHRRVLALRAATAVAVAAVAATAVLATAGKGPSRPARPAPVPTVVDREREFRMLSGIDSYPDEVFMADATNGYGRFFKCPTSGSASCTVTLRVTHDGGHTYTPINPPAEVIDIPLFTFGPDTAVLAPGIDAFVTHVTTWVTSDGGLTWRPVDRPIATADRIPTGARIEGIDASRVSGIYAVSADGTVVNVTTVPPHAVPVIPAASAGAYLVSTPDAWYVSTDQGHTWGVVDTPLDVSRYELDGNPVAFADGRIYTLLNGGGGHQWIMTSTDGGRTWQDTALPAATPQPSGAPGHENWLRFSAGVTPDGDIVVNDGARTWRMPRGGTAFTPDDQAFPIIYVTNDGPLVLAVSADMRLDHPVPTVYLSPDGLTWQHVDW